LLLALALDALEGSSIEGSSVVEGSSAAKLGSPPAVVFHSCHLCTLAWAAVSSAELEVSSLVLPLIRIAHAALVGTNTALAGTNTALDGTNTALDGTNTAPSASLAHGADDRSSSVHGSLLDLGSSAAKLGHDGLGSSAAKLGHGTLLDLSSAPIWRAVRKTEATTISRELACHADDRCAQPSGRCCDAGSPAPARTGGSPLIPGRVGQ
jgi:hypothetical protein